MLDARCWLLDAGCWMLDAGYWLLLLLLITAMATRPSRGYLCFQISSSNGGNPVPIAK